MNSRLPYLRYRARVRSSHPKIPFWSKSSNIKLILCMTNLRNCLMSPRSRKLYL
nr:MAG TPA: hypothetical protein [Caudoviricetes sp.]